ncbi:MAG TPA: dNTP triphosphohydrolase [Saprospiraceae bacterium]|nr:dNTP triphosphohydrolase [Saprospiraceae bacterium]
MDWSTCYSEGTIGRNRSSLVPRSHFQIDYDRLIFSSPFRRLQSKTQVFPLPGTAFVHNRLTHSLEVASVGRSLGTLAGHFIADHIISSNDNQSRHFYNNELSNVISAACLAHDVGNPAFGHSGESAISQYFIDHQDSSIDDEPLISFFNEKEWTDLTHFEGNANALRVLTKSYPGKGEGGLGLTKTTLASILKYPCESLATNKNYIHRKKFGFFQSEKEVFLDITGELGMLIENHMDLLIYKRHPFVYLVEAADDICYNMIDLEDAHRLGILQRDRVAEAMFNVIKEICLLSENLHSIERNYKSLTDDNAAISYLRSKTINFLVEACADIFKGHVASIIQGKFESTLMIELENEIKALKTIKELSIEKIYRHPSVVEVEMAGYHVISFILNLFIPAVLTQNPSPQQKAALRLIPLQYSLGMQDADFYSKTMFILDHVAGMTDDFATETYRKITGIEIARH